MTTVTGDRYLDLLSTFIRANTGPLLDGGLVLKLNPVGLHYVQTRLEALEELEALQVGAPVDYLRAYVADLGDHRALEQLRGVLRLLSSAKLVSMVPAPSRDPTPVTLQPLSRLRSLELRGCDLSTSAARGLLELRPFLEKLVCQNSADALRHIFSERTKEIQDSPPWSRLTEVSCFSNGMLLMDESLQLLPVVEALDLSRNRFAKVANLQKCSKLKFLDAGFNHITTVASLNKIVPRITKLVLRNNALVSTRGLHRIASLEALDLSYNLISNFREVEVLGKLPSLRLLWLEGNPLTFSRLYRGEALSYFLDPIKFVLDGKQTSRVESCAARRIVSRRLQQRSKYGAFSPARTLESCASLLQWSDSGELEDSSLSNGGGPSLLRAKKKNSRMASIQDHTGLQSASRAVQPTREGSFSSLASYDSVSAVQSIAESKEQMEETVQDLIQRAEVLKRAGSSTWLKDLNNLLENDVENKSQLLAQIERMDLDASQESPSLSRRRTKRRQRKGSFRASSSVSRDSEGGMESEEHDQAESSRARLPRENSMRRMSKGLARDGSGSLVDEDYRRVANLSTADSLDELQRSFVFGEDQPRSLPDYPIDGGGLKLHDQSGTFRLTEELVTGKMFASQSSSPPQFNQDILDRRQNLERELLHLPPDREISPFLDSDSSSGTIYSQFSESSDSPAHSPSTVWHPFRFEHGQNLELSSAKTEKSDSEDNLQMWSDIEAPERETLKSGEPDGKYPTVAQHTNAEPEPSKQDPTSTIHTTEGKERGEIDTTLVVHSEEGRELDGKDIALEVHPDEGKEAAENNKSLPVDIHKTKLIEVHEAPGGQVASSSSSSKDGPLIGEGNTSECKNNSAGEKEQSNLRTSSPSQPKSKSVRRVVQLESLSGASPSPGSVLPSPRGSSESLNIHQRSMLQV